MEMHLDGGHTRVVIEATEGVGLADGGIRWDLPTRGIPLALRALGSRFVVTVSAAPSTGREDLAALRARLRTFGGEPLG
ncbi:MAG: hypothetical protein KC586_24160 [Myxococcales bacterium]|nr:hypothetical protein [Myxococcales bacterium]